MPTVWPFLTPLLLLSSAVQSSTAQSTIDPSEFQARRRAPMEKVPCGIILLRHWLRMIEFEIGSENIRQIVALAVVALTIVELTLLAPVRLITGHPVI